MKKTKRENPTPGESKAAFKMWMGGGLSVWQVKHKTGFKARVLIPLFEKMLGKKITGPAQRMPVKGKSSAKEEPSRRAA